MIKIAPSILAADFAAMGKAVEQLEGWGADWVHVDVMDGHFVPNITFGPGMCWAIRQLTSLPLDVHLMVEEPAKWVKPFAEAGADVITVHVEADAHVHRTLQTIRDFGKKAGVVLNPGTPPIMALPVLSLCDIVLVMSVNPGFGGQRFIPDVLEKIRTLRGIADQQGVEVDIEVDGGVNPETARLCREAGANVLVAGSSLFGAQNPREMVAKLRGE